MLLLYNFILDPLVNGGKFLAWNSGISTLHATNLIIRCNQGVPVVMDPTIPFPDISKFAIYRALARPAALLPVLALAAFLGPSPARADREMAVAMHQVLVDQFIASHPEPPTELILDFDATDDPVHGNQEGRFFHGYYDHYCFLPLYVTCRDQLLVAYLRPSNIDGAKHAWAILALLVKRLRQEWPQARIIFRGDSGFCRWRMLAWCDRHGVYYIVGLAKNRRINEMAAPLIDKARKRCEATGRKQRLFGNPRYGARTWDRQRRVIARIEHSSQGSNPRHVVTNLPGNRKKLYERIYCARGEMENRIKEQKMLFADRTSAHDWWPNQFRLLLSALAYTLLEAMRRLGLKGTELARAQVATIRLKLLKIGAVIVRNTRRVRFLLSSAHPYQHLFWLVAAWLKPG